ncbi:MAG: Uma2 family endonuclease [Blastocatellia bacterium]
MSVRKRREVEVIDYPESDGEPMGETDFHIQLIFELRSVLRDFFRREESMYVASNLILYYVEGDPTKCVAPDVFVARGVGNHARRIYKLWEEKHPPAVVIEVSSRKTKNDDLKWKRQLYAWFGVNEYFIFDPEYKLKPPLRAYRLRGKEYVEEAVTSGRVMSNELGLELVNTGETLRLRDPRTGQFLPTPEENAAARREAEAARQTEAAARQRAEAELEKLRAELARLKGSAARKRTKKTK